jgi:DNA-binding NarL/FixJ family response regulator
VSIETIGCPSPYREAIDQRLSERSLSDAVSEANVVLVHCDTPDRLEEVAAMATAGDRLPIAVLPQLSIDSYIDAFEAGAAAAVYADTPSSITVDVIAAAIQGEVLIPRHAAQAMAAMAKRRRPPTELGEQELVLLRAVCAGSTIVDLAKSLHYSERTVRRHLQSLYLKLGVGNRAEAIAAASRMGLVD